MAAAQSSLLHKDSLENSTGRVCTIWTKIWGEGEEIGRVVKPWQEVSLAVGLLTFVLGPSPVLWLSANKKEKTRRLTGKGWYSINSILFMSYLSLFNKIPPNSRVKDNHHVMHSHLYGSEIEGGVWFQQDGCSVSHALVVAILALLEWGVLNWARSPVQPWCCWLSSLWGALGSQGISAVPLSVAWHWSSKSQDQRGVKECGQQGNSQGTWLRLFHVAHW